MLASGEAIRKLQEQVKLNKIDAFLVNELFDLAYLFKIDPQSGFFALVTGDDVKVLCPEMIYDQLNDTLTDASVIKCNNIYEELRDLAGKKKIKSIGIDSGRITCRLFDKLKKELPGIKWETDKCLLSIVRQIKSAAEISLIRKACKITVKVFNIVKKEIKPGMTELFIAKRINYLCGINDSTFNGIPIVASGKNAAYPHHVSSGRKIEKNDCAVIDFAAIYKDHYSDYTRPVFIGRQNDAVRKIYAVVKEAQEKAVKKVKAGIRANFIDKTARDVIEKAGFGKQFMHGTGHGLGLQIHELPSVNKSNTEKLRANMVITVEPGIYIHNVAGMRIEDTVLVTGKGYEILT